MAIWLIPTLLHVLNLFAELINHRFHLQPDAREAYIGRLGAKRIRLAIELLCQKIEPTSCGLLTLNQSTGLFDMGREPIKLLTDIGLGGQQCSFLRQSLFRKSWRSAKEFRHLFHEP